MGPRCVGKLLRTLGALIVMVPGMSADLGLGYGRNVPVQSMIIYNSYYAYTLYEYNNCGEKIEKTSHPSHPFPVNVAWSSTSKSADRRTDRQTTR